MRRTLALALLMPLLAMTSGCANDSNDFVELQALLQPGKAQPDPRIQPLLDADAPRLQVGFLDSGLAGVMLLENSRDGVRTWLSVDGATLLTRQGMIVGERGFGAGLMASDIAQSMDAVLGGYRAETVRFHSFLTGNDRTEMRSYKCVVENRGDKIVTIRGTPTSTRMMRETCNSTDQNFVNVYWISNTSGQIVQSRQWLGDFAGVVTTRQVSE